MRVYTCLPEELERQFWGKMPESARRMNVLDIERVERDVQSGGVAVFSKYSRIASDFGGTLLATRPTSLGTPSISGDMDGIQPRLSWSAVSGATKYQIIRYSTDGTTGRLDYLPTTTNTSWVDQSTYGVQYYGTTQLYDGVFAYYKIIAIGGTTEVSAASTPVYYRTTLTCSGKC